MSVIVPPNAGEDAQPESWLGDLCSEPCDGEALLEAEMPSRKMG